MDLTNRILAVGVALLWIFAALLVILLAWGAPDQSIERLSDLAGYLDDHNTAASKLIVTFGGLILVLLAVVVIIYEVAPPESGSVRVTRVGSGDVRIGVDEITYRVEAELRLLPQVNQVSATVLARGRKAEISLDLHVAPEADLAAITEEACRRARELVEGSMGVELSCQPRAQIHYRELRVARAGRAPSQATPTRTPAAQPPMSGSTGAGAPVSAPAQPPAPSPSVAPERPDDQPERPQEDPAAGA